MDYASSDEVDHAEHAEPVDGYVARDFAATGQPVLAQACEPVALERWMPPGAPDDAATTALARAEAELARARAVFDAVPDGLAETDVRGVMRAANPRLAYLLSVHPSFLRGKPLLHFVARGDCRAFRDLLDAVAKRGEHDAVIVRLRPRHGGRPFPAELRARSVRVGGARVVVWTVRAWSEPLAAGGARASTSLAAIVRQATDAIRLVAAARRVAIVEEITTAAALDDARVAATLAGLEDLARAALRLTADGEALRIEARDGDAGDAVVTFGCASMRVPAPARCAVDGDGSLDGVGASPS